MDEYSYSSNVYKNDANFNPYIDDAENNTHKGKTETMKNLRESKMNSKTLEFIQEI